MRALVVESDGTLAIREMSTPEPNDYQVVVKTVACGICNGTDIKIIHKKFKAFNTYPAILGHEGVGKVVKKGKKVISFKIGDNILKPSMYKPIDGYYGGYGGFAEYGTVNDWRALVKDGYSVGTNYFREADYARQVLPADFDPVSSAMINTFCEVLSALKRFGFKKDESIVIFGCGAVGQSFTHFAKILGLNSIIVCDIDKNKLKIAQKMGADYIINNKGEDVKERVRRICPDGVDYVIDCVGRTQIINQGMELINYNGKICAYGISGNLNMELDWSKAPHNWNLQFIQVPTYKEEASAFTEIVDWIKNGTLVQEDFISQVVDFDNIIEAFELAEQGRAGKIIVKYST